MPAEIRAFFEHYRKEPSIALMVRLWRASMLLPSGIASDGGYTHWPTFEAIRANMDALCVLYRENGYVGATIRASCLISPRARLCGR